LNPQIPGYEIAEELGRGGMAIVYRARQVRLDRQVALKVLPPQFTFDPSFVERFEREARLAANLEHANIVPIYDMGQVEHLYYIAMQYVEGETLEAKLREGRLPPDTALKLLRQIAAALDFAHSRGVIHRDIKPSNIMIRPDGTALLMDFGIARASAGANLTQATAQIGTPHYMAPEQCLSPQVDHRADLYSLGVVLFQMLTGEVPFAADNVTAILYRHQHDPPPPLAQFQVRASPAIEAVVQRAMAKSPAERYASGAEMVEALARAIGSTPAISSTPAAGMATSLDAGFNPADLGPRAVTGRGSGISIGTMAGAAGAAPTPAPADLSEKLAAADSSLFGASDAGRGAARPPDPAPVRQRPGDVGPDGGARRAPDPTPAVARPTPSPSPERRTGGGAGIGIAIAAVVVVLVVVAIGVGAMMMNKGGAAGGGGGGGSVSTPAGGGGSTAPANPPKGGNPGSGTAAAPTGGSGSAGGTHEPAAEAVKFYKAGKERLDEAQDELAKVIQRVSQLPKGDPRAKKEIDIARNMLISASTSALENAGRAMQADPEYARGYCLRIAAYRALYDPKKGSEAEQKATEALAEALQKFPNDADVLAQQDANKVVFTGKGR
jgi:serine/threonine-protein kinase